ERELARQPAPEGVVELLVVALRVGGGRHPPADVDVEGEQLLGQPCAPSHRVEVAAAEVARRRAVDRVGEGLALPELELVPDEVDEVVLVGVWFGWLRAAPAL